MYPIVLSLLMCSLVAPQMEQAAKKKPKKPKPQPAKAAASGWRAVLEAGVKVGAERIRAMPPERLLEAVRYLMQNVEEDEVCVSF
jgi:hypothetical protein